MIMHDFVLTRQALTLVTSKVNGSNKQILKSTVCCKRIHISPHCHMLTSKFGTRNKVQFLSLRSQLKACLAHLYIKHTQRGYGLLVNEILNQKQIRQHTFSYQPD